VGLEGLRVRLSPIQQKDSRTLFRWINDRDLVILSAPYRFVSHERHRLWFNTVQQRDDTRIFAIRLGTTGRLIGTCQLHGIDPMARSAELQIRIGCSDVRGRGYGTDAVNQLVRFGFDDLNLHRIHLHVFATNAAAHRAYEKAGFVVEARLRDAAYIDGRYVDVLIMSVLNDR